MTPDVPPNLDKHTLTCAIKSLMIFCLLLLMLNTSVEKGEGDGLIIKRHLTQIMFILVEKLFLIR